MSASSLSVSAGCRGGQSLEALLDISASQLCQADIAEMNLLCATSLPGAENLGVGRCLATLDAWARRVRRETDRHLYRFRQAPAEFNHSEGYFRMLMLVTVLQQDFGVRYNPDRIRGIDFRDSRDLFIHGLLDEPHTGTCASMPVLYVAAGRRLGYPLKLVLTHGHIFARWEDADGRDRFNVECASRGMLSFPDEYYKTWPTALTNEQVRKGRYLLSLGAAEELAVFVESRGHCLLDNGRIREARIAYEHACRLDPLSPGHWCWLDDARVREASRPPGGDNWKTFSNWGCSMTISCLPIANSTLSAEPVRTFPLDSTRYRNYHPTLGRWIERDPVPARPGPNLTEYAISSPPNYTDPYGLRDITIKIQVTGEMPQTWPGDRVVEQAFQTVLDTCFKCCQDKVTVKIERSKQRVETGQVDSRLGLFPKPKRRGWWPFPQQSPPTEWRQEVYAHRDSAVGEIGYTSGSRTSISSQVADTRFSADVKATEYGQTWGNILAHETLYHGMLGQSDVLIPDKDTPEMYTNRAPSSHPVQIPKEMCDKLKKMLQVKCEEPTNAR